MPLYFKIAIRYLFGKKSTNAINIISGISIFGIAIGSAALILILSVFNGFEGLMKKYLDAFNSDIKVEAYEGKFFIPDTELLNSLLALHNVEMVSLTAEEVAIFEFDDNQEVGIIKGVDSRFRQVTGIDSAIIDGQFDLADTDMNYAAIGAGIASKLNLSTENRINPLKIYMPNRNRSGPLDSEFKSRNVFPNSIFSLRNEKDHQYILVDLYFAQELIELRDEVSSIEIKLKDLSSEKKTVDKVQKIVGSEFKVLNRYQQDESFLKIMNIEKWSAFVILGFTLILIIFNVIGSLWMIVLEKKRDISVLQAMGLKKMDVKKIFFTEGLLISSLGFVLGLFSAIILYLGQLRFGWIGVSNAFSKTAYPIEMKAFDVMLVCMLVLILGLTASIPATRRAGQITAYIRSE
jgi:lipoprotein-releasing system permease protein